MMSPTTKSRNLIYVWIGIFGLIWALLIVRFFTIQVLWGEEWAARIPKQSEKRLVLEPQRGIIYDRNFNMLAFNLPRFSFGANPARVKNPHTVATQLAKATQKSAAFYLKRLRSERKFVWLDRGVLLKQAEQVKFPINSGITTIRKSRRFYPNYNLISQVIGFTNVDNVGISGVESQYDQLLQGRAGWKEILVDGARKSVPEVAPPEKPPVDGKSLVLTIDREYQMIAEDELRKGIEKYEARGGMVLILDPDNGDVLTMASLPSYDPNSPGKFSIFKQKNRTITDMYEPGSPFKIVTAAAALQEHIVNPTDKIYCENGSYRIPGSVITDHKKFKFLTFQQVIEHSSNIGTAKIAHRIGEDKIYRYARAFGFGNITGIDLPGEAAGVLRNPIYWSASDLYHVAIGYGVSVTALQLACAYAAVANDGVLMKPRIVKAILSDRGEILEEKKPVVIRRVISESTAGTLRQFFIGVVERGTGTEAKIAGVRVAGKTGTAHKFNPGTGKYFANKYIATFVGFFSFENATLVCLVMMDEPHKFHCGGQTCAPVFKHIVKRILDLIHSKQMLAQNSNYSFSTSRQQATITLCTARNLPENFDRCNWKNHVDRSQKKVDIENKVKRQSMTKSVNGISEEYITLSDVRKMSLRDAVRLLTEAGCKIKVVGTGRVVDQYPKAGSIISRSEHCVIYCQSEINRM